MASTQLIRQASLFKNLDPSEAAKVQAIARTSEVAAGAYVFTEGSQATSLFIVESGIVEILKEGAVGSKLVVAELGPGSLFGEMAFVDRAPRSTAAAAKGAVKSIEIRYGDLDKLITDIPPLGLKIYQSIAETLCARIRRTTSDLSSLLLS